MIFFNRIYGQNSKAEQEKVVIYGGSFNPPTLVHYRLLLDAVNSIGAAKGIFVPASNNYVADKMKKIGHPEEVLPEKVRAEMLLDMCGIADGTLTVDECEFGDDGCGHTFETMMKIQRKYPDSRLFCLIGSDKLSAVSRWHDRERFFADFEFIVVKRGSDEPERVIEQNPQLQAAKKIFHIISGPEDISKISSTLVRECIRRGDETAKTMVTPGVWQMLTGRSFSDK